MGVVPSLDPFDDRVVELVSGGAGALVEKSDLCIRQNDSINPLS